MLELLGSLFTDYTVRTVALGSAALGVVSGALGAFAVLRRQSLLGDAISHAALPGIVLAFLLTGSKSTLVLVLGAAAAGWLGTLVVMGVVGATRVPEDSALGIVLSVFFGGGLVLLTLVQHMPDARQAGLETFLFGQAATLLERDVAVIIGLGAAALLLLFAGWKQFKLLAFDPEFGASLGLRMRFVDVVLTSLLVVAIVIGLQTVGVVLMSAMVVAPAAAARQWTDHLGRMVVLSGGFGALAGVAGALASSAAPGVATGPAIVLAVTAVVIISLTLAPRRGVVWQAARRRREQRRIAADTVLMDLGELAARHERADHAHPAAVLEAVRGRGVDRVLIRLEERGLAARSDAGWALTPQGRERAEALRSGREETGA